MNRTGLLITRDLFFASKVTSTAQALGLTVRSVGTLQPVQDAAATGGLGLVILDLDFPGVTPQEVMAQLPSGANIVTVAFGPHVHEEKLARSTRAGFQHVLPRSKFSAGLAALLQSALRTETAD